MSLSRKSRQGQQGCSPEEMTQGLCGTFHEKHVWPQVIVPLVQEGTRNDLQMAPVQTLHPQPPPAPAWLCFLSPKGGGQGNGGSQISPRWESQNQLHSCLWGMELILGFSPCSKGLGVLAGVTPRSRCPLSPPCVPALLSHK